MNEEQHVVGGQTAPREHLHREKVGAYKDCHVEGKLVGILAMNDLVLHSDRNGGKETAVPYDEMMTAFKGICDHPQLLTQHAVQA